jgi:hypothetical protein
MSTHLELQRCFGVGLWLLWRLACRPWQLLPAGQFASQLLLQLR